MRKRGWYDNVEWGWAVVYELAYDGGGSDWWQYYRTRHGALVSAWWNLYITSWGGSATLIEIDPFSPTNEEVKTWKS